jgi:serine/threonine-protein kinase SRPK3
MLCASLGKQESDRKGFADTGDQRSSDGDYSNDGDEGLEDYKPGGYHPVHLGDVFNNRYLVVEKLGWGHFSTVWMCLDKKHTSESEATKYLALKIQKSAPHYREAAYDEIELLRTVSTTAFSSAFAFEQGAVIEPPKVVLLLDNFEHAGPNGRHVCMVFEALGENLLEVIKKYDYRGLPVRVVKHMAYDILLGLDFLHRHCSMIHTDLKVVHS